MAQPARTTTQNTRRHSIPITSTRFATWRIKSVKTGLALISNRWHIHTRLFPPIMWGVSHPTAHPLRTATCTKTHNWLTSLKRLAGVWITLINQHKNHWWKFKTFFVEMRHSAVEKAKNTSWILCDGLVAVAFRSMRWRIKCWPTPIWITLWRPLLKRLKYWAHKTQRRFLSTLCTVETLSRWHPESLQISTPN